MNENEEVDQKVDVLNDPNWTPAVATAPTTVPAPTPSRGIEVTRVPKPTHFKSNGKVVVPQVNGVDYYSGDQLVRGVHNVSDGGTITAQARKSYRFAEGVNTSWDFS